MVCIQKLGFAATEVDLSYFWHLDVNAWRALHL